MTTILCYFLKAFMEVAIAMFTFLVGISLKPNCLLTRTCSIFKDRYISKHATVLDFLVRFLSALQNSVPLNYHKRILLIFVYYVPASNRVFAALSR